LTRPPNRSFRNRATAGAGWTITYVAGINNLGQIVGIGLDNGTPAVFVMTPR
jgi:hypothetical protein